MKIYDCFLLLNELDLLEFRIKFLYDYVDYFVVCEASHTYSGKEKPFNLLKNWSRFSKYGNKIIYLTADLDPKEYVFDSISIPNHGESWLREYAQRNYLWQLKNHDLQDDDLVLLGDLDELPEPGIIEKYRLQNRVPKKPKTLVQIFHNYYMNLRNIGTAKKWCGTIVMSGKDFKAKPPQKHRDKRTRYSRISNGGWHFSYLGGAGQIKYKIESFAHQEFNHCEIVNENHISKSLENSKDVLKRNGHKLAIIDVAGHKDYIPELVSLMCDYPDFLVEKNEIQLAGNSRPSFISLFNRLTQYPFYRP